MIDKNRILYIDVLKTMSIIAVITIHTSGIIDHQYFKTNIVWWWIGNIYDALSRWAVPIMIMISGILLLDPTKDYTMKIFFKKRFNKVLIPLIFWGVIYTIWKYRTDIIIGKNLPLWDITRNFIGGPLYYHLWFLYVILGLYTLTPILRIYIKNANIGNMKYFLIIWFITNGIINFVGSLTNYVLRVGIVSSFFVGYIGYYVMGHYLTIAKIKEREKDLLYFMVEISLIITMIGTFALTRNKGEFVDTFNNNLAPNVIFMTIGIFIFIKNVDWNNIMERYPSIKKIVLEISSLSFGIYLIHLLILEYLKNYYKIDPRMFNPLVSIPLMVVIIFSISYAIIKLMKKLPIVEKVVP